MGCDGVRSAKDNCSDISEGEGGSPKMPENANSIEKRKHHENSRLVKIGRPGLRLKKKAGAPKGNKNAFSHGRHTAERRAFRYRLVCLRRRAKAAIAQAEALIQERKRLAREAGRALAVTASKNEAGALAPVRSWCN